MEPSENIAKVCSSCMKNKHSTTQEKIASMKMEDFVGMYAKKSFSKGKQIEHMWVHITSVNEKSQTLCGIIDNESILVDETKNDEVIFYKEDIEELLTSDGKGL